MIRKLAPAAALLATAGTCLVVAFLWPEPPDEPRYVGAGHEEPQHGGTFIFYHDSNVRSLDPHVAYDELSFMAVRLLYDGLLDYDYDGKLKPSLARDMPEISEDGRTFTFELRRNVHFHNGQELTARDVRWSFEHLLAGETGSPGYPFYKSIVGAEAYHTGKKNHIEGLEVVDRYTVRFTLSKPDHTFLNVMAMPFAYPVPEAMYAGADKQPSIDPIGTGPYELHRWERGVKLVFTRNERYWQPEKPYPDRMVYLENLERHVAAMRFRNGDIDTAHRFPSADYLFFKHSDAWAPYRKEYPEVSTFGIGMNCQMKPFDDVHLRRAVAFAIDRKGWSRARNNRLLPAGQVVPPQLAGHDDDLPHRQYFDLERAREEMRLAGHPDGLEQTVTIMTTEGDTGRFYGELIQQDLAEIGIDVNVRQVSFAVYLQQTGKPDTVQAFTTGWNQDFPDASNFLDPLFHSRSIHPVNSENRAFYRNPELDQLLDEARAETDPDKRTRMYRQANDIVAKDAPWAFTYYPLSMELWQPYVRGYRPHPIWGKDYRNLWLDLPRKRATKSYAGHGAPAPAAVFPFGAF